MGCGVLVDLSLFCSVLCAVYIQRNCEQRHANRCVGVPSDNGYHVLIQRGFSIGRSQRARQYGSLAERYASRLDSRGGGCDWTPCVRGLTSMLINVFLSAMNVPQLALDVVLWQVLLLSPLPVLRL